VADVTVIDTTAGRHYKPRGDDGMAASDALDHTSKVEARVQGKISEALRYIPGVIVAVNAHVDTRKTMTSTSTVLPVGEGTVSTISRDTSDSTESSQPRAPGGAPGVRANVADDINNGAGGGGGKNTTERTESEFKVLPGTRKQDVVDARGLPTRVSVTVNVPQEYLVAMVRAGKPDADRKAEVARADLDAAFATEKDRLTKDLQPLVESAIAGSDPTGAFTTVAGTVQVSMIPVPLADWGPGAAGAGSGGAQAGASLGSLEGLMGSGLVRQGVLAVFAVGALGMMFLMVRKSAKPATLPTAQEIVGVPPPLEAQNDLVGEADESQTAIEGIELGDAELKSKKMLEQVSDLVKNNPADAANLLNRWIQTES
jgi:flagellar biosynthesis/type III secretory pathway M-ring protein FliF/YscJ